MERKVRQKQHGSKRDSFCFAESAIKLSNYNTKIRLVNLYILLAIKLLICE